MEYLIVAASFATIGIIFVIYKIWNKLEEISKNSGKKMANEIKNLMDRFETTYFSEREDLFKEFKSKSDLSSKVQELKSEMTRVQQTMNEMNGIVKANKERMSNDHENIKDLIDVSDGIVEKLSNMEESISFIQDYLEERKKEREETLSNIG